MVGPTTPADPSNPVPVPTIVIIGVGVAVGVGVGSTGVGVGVGGMGVGVDVGVSDIGPEHPMSPVMNTGIITRISNTAGKMSQDRLLRNFFGG